MLNLTEQPIVTDSISLSDKQIYQLGGGVSSVLFSVAEKRMLKKKQAIMD